MSLTSLGWRHHLQGFQLYFTWQGSVKTTIEFICDPNAGVGTMAPVCFPELNDHDVIS